MSNILDTLNPPTTSKPVEDCVSCRVIGGLTLTALGGYGIGQAIMQGKALSRAAAAGTPPVPGGPTKRGLAIMAFFGVGEYLASSSLTELRQTRALTLWPIALVRDPQERRSLASAVSPACSTRTVSF